MVSVYSVRSWQKVVAEGGGERWLQEEFSVQTAFEWQRGGNEGGNNGEFGGSMG